MLDKEPRDENGLKHGYWEKYYHNGDLVYKGSYIHGKEHGYWEHTSIFGFYLEKCNYIFGLKHGLEIGGFKYGITKFNTYHNGLQIYITTTNKKLI